MTNSVKTLTFNGVNSRNQFLINRIRRSIMPPLDIPTVEIPRRAGAIGLRTDIGPRTIEVDITILATGNTDMRNRIKGLASWLFQLEDRPLIFSDDPDVFINARLSTETDLNMIAQIGEGTLTFICNDPFYYRNVQISTLLGSNERVLLNIGTFQAFPHEIRILPHASVTNLRLTNHRNGKHILIHSIPAWELTVVDNLNNSIYRDIDKRRAFDRLDISSDFFPLEVGDNRITLSRTPESVHVDVRFIYRERFL